jgi:hypothetical protein
LPSLRQPFSGDFENARKSVVMAGFLEALHFQPERH